MHGYLSADIICSKIQTFFRERSSGKTVSLEKHIKSKEKYTCIFSRKTDAILFIILQIFCNTWEKMFANSLLFAAWEEFFGVFSSTT